MSVKFCIENWRFHFFAFKILIWFLFLCENHFYWRILLLYIGLWVVNIHICINCWKKTWFLCSFVGVINISCDISNSCIKFYGEVPKGLASSILETYEEEDTLPVINNAIPDRYGRGNYNAAVTCCHNTSTYITRSLHRLIGYKTRFSDKEC